MIEHFYQDIPGHFTFEDFYSFVAARAQSKIYDPHFKSSGSFRTYHAVEVGVENGRSAAYLLVELVNRLGAVSVQLDLVDNFGWSAQGAMRVQEILSRAGQVNTILSDSAEAASRYADRNLDFVYIDANHEYMAVGDDIDSWLQKVRKGGILAGHDFCVEFPGVVQAVTERFDRFQVWRGSKYENGKYYPTWWVEL